ncbi:Variant surface glycoprotein [Trypanosoma congolense IL3000]|uniref:Variant surface glycoprotein n=1 Tax=Trypanosoma congolense (strain IL3000) TaxID=1068625 RepID=F9WB53_TRYCI|nr:Variant surface glycoprotein [Trypanosoma congolense IL3000]
MRMVKFCFIVFLVVMGVLASFVVGEEEDHNKGAHERLCNVLREAVGMWEDGGARLSAPLKTALGRTIFGKDSDWGTVVSLKNSFPSDYKGVSDTSGSRYFLCGDQPQQDHSPMAKTARRPGHSAPHDLVCLCTAGDGGWPVNGTVGGEQTLCGKQANKLGVETEKKGWSHKKNEGENQIQATWTNVVQECLQGTDKGTRLKDALNTFIEKLGTVTSGANTYKVLGYTGRDAYPCSGSKIQGICVKYYPEEQNAIPWWKQLEDAINKDEAEKQQKRREEESSKQENSQKRRDPQKKDQPQPTQEPRTAALRSAPQSSQEDEQDNTENISNPIATLEDTSGTPIISPCTWFLSALLFI